MQTQTRAQMARTLSLVERSAKLKQHEENCQALVQAYVRRRQRSERILRREIDTLLAAETRAPALWEPAFDPDQFLDTLPPTVQRRYGL